MKKIKLITICVLLASFCCSCGLVGKKEYFCEANDVSSIQIVKLINYVEGEYRFEYDTLAEISDLSAFINQLNSIKHSVNWGEPGILAEGFIVIRIYYNNGDYDLLYPNAQWFNRDGTNQYGYFFFDEEQLNQLITEWCGKTEDGSMSSSETTE